MKFGGIIVARNCKLQLKDYQFFQCEVIREMMDTNGSTGIWEKRDNDISHCLFSTNNKISVATEPNTRESKNQFSPVLFFPCASAALINANVPQPTKYWLSIICPPFPLTYLIKLKKSQW